MEVLSARGLPKGKMGKYVISKADFIVAEQGYENRPSIMV
jgi:hypothetical protein